MGELGGGKEGGERHQGNVGGKTGQIGERPVEAIFGQQADDSRFDRPQPLGKGCDPRRKGGVVEAFACAFERDCVGIGGRMPGNGGEDAAHAASPAARLAEMAAKPSRMSPNITRGACS